MRNYANTGTEIGPQVVPAAAAPVPVPALLLERAGRAPMPDNPRASYFTHGAYAAARPGGPRLKAPDVPPERRNAAGAGPRRPQARRPAAQA